MSDLTFKSLTFQNFMSFGNVPVMISFEKPGTCFITGENLDDGGSSGAGKTTLINALSYVLFDKVPDKISKERLINRTNKDEKKTVMEVTLNLTKGGDEYLIKRFRGQETGYKLIHVNHPEEADKDITNAGGFNSSVEELIGFSYELFKQIILFNGNSAPFLSLPVGDQRDLIEELLKITLLSRKAEALKKLITTIDQNIKIQEALVAQQKVQLEKQKKQVQEAEGRVVAWEDGHENRLNDERAKLAQIEAVDFEAEEQRHAELAELNVAHIEATSALQLIENQKRAKNSELLQFPKKTELALLKSTYTEQQRDHVKVITELKHLRDAKCPYCLQKFADAKTKIKDLESKQASLDESNKTAVTGIAECEQAEVDYNAKVTTELTAIIDELKAKQAELDALNSAAKELKRTLAYPDLKSALAAKNAKAMLIANISTVEAEANPHVDALETLLASGDSKVDTAELDSIVRLKEHYQLLLKLLTDKNSFIRKAIISKTLPFLNKRIAFYTERLGLPHVVKFQPDMSCEITQYGRDLDHGNLSNGQKKRLNLSLCFAFRDALTYLHSKVNVLFTDEIDGGSLDEQSVNLMIGLLKHKAWDDAIGIYIISHRPEFDGRCDRNVVVRLEGGFSTIIEQAED